MSTADSVSNGSLYGKVLNRDGTVALIAFVLVGFFMYVYVSRLDNMQATLVLILQQETLQTRLLAGRELSAEQLSLVESLQPKP